MPLKRKFRIQMEVEFESFDHDGSEPLLEIVRNDVRDLVSLELDPNYVPYLLKVTDIQIEQA